MEAEDVNLRVRSGDKSTDEMVPRRYPWADISRSGCLELLARTDFALLDGTPEIYVASFGSSGVGNLNTWAIGPKRRHRLVWEYRVNGGPDYRVTAIVQINDGITRITIGRDPGYNIDVHLRHGSLPEADERGYLVVPFDNYLKLRDGADNGIPTRLGLD